MINTHFEYRRLPFGVASALSIFQRVMQNLLQEIPPVCIYIDDILMTGAMEEEHLPTLAQVLQRLESAGMRLKQEKCAFLLKSVSYLRHVISAEGLHTSDSKVKAVVDAPDLRNISELRSFLGMVNYYGLESCTIFQTTRKDPPAKRPIGISRESMDPDPH